MFVRSVVGALALVAAFGPLVVGSYALRRKLLPGWSGPPGWLAQFVVVLTACLVTALVLGTVGWYSLVPTATLLVAMGVGLLVAAYRVAQRHGAPAQRQPERLGRPAQVVAIVAVSLFAATWGARTYVALSHGMVSIDSLWYHLPQAARFAHEQSITSTYHDVPDLSGFYPINAEIFHSLGMVFLGNDLISMVLTLGWGIVALVAAWCIGRPHGMAAVCVTGMTVLLSAPGFVGTQPGAAHSDIVGVALVLLSAAVLVTADANRVTGNPMVLALAAMPIGIAVGTKWTLIPIAVAMTLGVLILLPRRRRIGLSAMWLAIVGLLGCFSYLRNLIKVGNPLPNIDLAIGPFGWERTAPEIGGMANVAGYVFDGAVWRDWFLPGLSQWFGYAWWAVLALVVSGLILSVGTGPGVLTRLLGSVAVLALATYFVQPQLLLLNGQPYYFSANLRYASSSIALALVLLPLSPVFMRRAVAWLPAGAFLIVIVVMQLDSAVWPTELRDLRWENPVRGADAVAGMVIGVVTLGAGLAYLFYGRRLRVRLASLRSGAQSESRHAFSRSRSARTAQLACLAIGAMVVGIVGLDRWYLAHRYTRPDAATPWLAQHWRSWQWARPIEDQKIGVQVPALTYPLFGNRLSNDVEPLPTAAAEGVGAPIDRRAKCVQFRGMVNDRHYDYVVFTGSIASLAPDELPPDLPPLEVVTPEVGWLQSDPGATRVFESPYEAAYRIAARLDPTTCPG